MGNDLYEQVFYSLDLIEKDYFGLQFTDANHVKHWLDPTKAIKKQVKSKFSIYYLQTVFSNPIVVSPTSWSTVHSSIKSEILQFRTEYTARRADTIPILFATET